MKTKIHNEGRGILFIAFLAFAIIVVTSWQFINILWVNILISASSLIVYGVMVNFFRAPKREYKGVLDVERDIIAPADGKVVVIEEVVENEYFKDKRLQVSIFMNLFNVHANWYPISGEVVHVSHQEGRFQSAYLPKSSTENERSTVVIKLNNGEEVLMRQIAGAMARRIVTYAKVGDEAAVNTQMGFIKFGSRVDLYLPLGTQVGVNLGDKTVGGETLIAKLPK